MSKFTTQSYYSTAVKLLHCSITGTQIIHSTTQTRSEKEILTAKEVSYTVTVLYYCTAGPTEIDNKVCDFHCQPINWKFN